MRVVRTEDLAAGDPPRTQMTVGGAREGLLALGSAGVALIAVPAAGTNARVATNAKLGGSERAATR